jgi:ATP-dependent protease ClpP protease subunit
MEDNRAVLEPYNEPVEINRYSFHLDEDIERPSYYRTMIEVMTGCSRADEVTIYFNTDGGSYDGMISIIHAIKACQCPVVGILYGKAYSAGAGILLNCTDIYVGENASIMVHSGFDGIGGKVSDIKAYVDFSNKENTRFINNVYSDFLTGDEMNRVERGDDLFFDSKESKEKLDLMFKKKHANAIVNNEPVH